MQAQATLPSEPRSVADARRFTASTLHEWQLNGISETATLLVSELASNALLHAHSDIEVKLTGDYDELTIYVCDHSRRLPVVRHYSRESGTGRGLRLVESLSRGWGVEQRRDGKCVWFTLLPAREAERSEEDEMAAYAAFDIDNIEAL